MTVSFTVPGNPVPKGRPRVTQYGTYTPKKTADYEKLVLRCWQAQSGQRLPPDTPLLASITAYFPIPKSLSKKKRAELDGTFHLKRPDADNIAKAVLDSLNGHAYADDSAVQIDRSFKLYSIEPRVEVCIRTEGTP